MRKKKERRTVDRSETLNPIEGNEKKSIEANGFFACYLLTSLSPRYKGHTYIGFTVNPRRRIRQHNGEIRSGAWRTKRRRPWEMVLCISGFPTNVSALQFEWAWQHPAESLAVRQAAATFKSFSGVANKIKLAYTMLSLPNWQSLSITVNYFSTKYSIHSASCPRLPDHMKVQVCTMEELPCYTGSCESLSGDEDDGGNEIHDEPSNNSGSLEEASTDTLNNISADCLHSDNEAFYEQCRLFKQYGREQPSDLSSLEVECRQPFDVNDLLTRTSSVVASSSTASTDGDIDVLVFIQESPDEKGLQGSKQVATEITVSENQQLWMREKRFTTAEIANKDQQVTQSSTVFQNVEVIDLLTPSPNCTVRSYQKKRRLPNISPVIIDLT